MSDPVPALPAALGPEPEIAADLDEALVVGYLGADDATERVRGWYPSTDQEAEWALRKLREIEDRAAEIKAKLVAWVEPIETWYETETARLAPAREFFTSRLETYALARRAEDPKAGKTTRLPSGQIATKASGGGDPKVVVVDEAAVIAWAGATFTGDEYEGVIATKESVKLTGLRAVAVVKEDPPLRTPDEWQEITGYRIADPDGWRGEHAFPWNVPIDRGDFLLRASISTILTMPEEPTAPEPPMGYLVVSPTTGEVIPGAAVEVPVETITATVKVDR